MYAGERAGRREQACKEEWILFVVSMFPAVAKGESGIDCSTSYSGQTLHCCAAMVEEMGAYCSTAAVTCRHAGMQAGRHVCKQVWVYR